MTASVQVEIPADQFFAALDAMAAPKVVQFRITFLFSKGPAFSTNVWAVTEDSAIATARRHAAAEGFSGAEKRKPTVYEVAA